MHIDQERFFKNFLITNELLVNKDLTKSEVKINCESTIWTKRTWD